MTNNDILLEHGVAIIGMSGRFPGASDLESYWSLLCEGKHGIRFFTDEELSENGIAEERLKDPLYVKAKGMLDDPEMFDASFFGMTPREAEWTDPQQRLFLECSYEALESAGWVPDLFKGRIGVFGGCSISTYLLNRIAHQQDALTLDAESLILGCDKDFITSRTAYKLNLKGPAITVQTACSTSLVAIHLACQSLLSGECDMALAGGSTVSFPNVTGYRYQEGMILSPDGFCRAFDSEARGTVPGNGVGIVALKRLEQATADGDHIFAVIRGSAANNDGRLKAGFTAPSPEGQAEVIADALALSGVHPDTISYVEAHGTATPIGDPIEITGLTRAYRQWTERSGYCAIGSVKSNLGHLDCAAGVAGLIKTVLALYYKQLPPSLNHLKPNPQISFANSPFYVHTQLTDWPDNGHPRRAGVSSFGIGATNAHIILEEAPSLSSDPSVRPWHVLLVSAVTENSLRAASERLTEHLILRLPGPGDLEEIAYTLQVGRKGYPLRCAIVCRNGAEAVRLLSQPTVEDQGKASRELRTTAWLFLPWRELHAEGLYELYRTEPVYRQHMNETLTIAERVSGLALKEILSTPVFVKLGGRPSAYTSRTWAIVSFAASYSLGKTLQQMGVQPDLIGGEEEGEYAAACLAELCSLEEAICLVLQQAERGETKSSYSHGTLTSNMPGEEPHLSLEVTGRTSQLAQSQSLLYARMSANNSVSRMSSIKVNEALHHPTFRVIGFGSPASVDRTESPRVISCYDCHTWTTALAALWTDGADLDWQARYQLEKRQRMLLPTYPFERQYFNFLPQAQREDLLKEHAPSSQAQQQFTSQIFADSEVENNPRADLLKTLIQFHSEVLGLPEEDIAIDVPFYELGADSLSMTQIISRIKNTYSFPLNVRQLFEAQTIYELADFIELSVLDLLEQEAVKE
ncbi:beta-ketoacyl synthase N-terminal-like domain-containing protein [Paenibacillus elgii]|uniref:type I polyketide synthase n=1 Tax=Paenibacillus elgii TaxID=189691 RepID=UPI000248C6EF|nr:beta-ketoacyl synthase N-terminal-like domain-containing protein [Paenibacillus elgii]